MREIWIEIDEKGDVTIEGKSANLGSSCTKLTEKLVADLGVKVSETLKPEYHRTRVVSRTAKA